MRRRSGSAIGALRESSMSAAVACGRLLRHVARAGRSDGGRACDGDVCDDDP